MSNNLIIIPTYNEIDNISSIAHTILNIEESFHLLIVDDNSPDGTAAKVKELQKIFPGKLHLIERRSKMGLGTAYITGFRWALKNNYEYIFEMDADFSHDPNHLPLLLKECKENGSDLAIGSRYVSGVNVINWPLSRILMSYLASVYVRSITGMPIQDTTAGFKCYRNSVLQTLDLDKIKFKGYAFQIEMKFAVWKLGFKVTEVPIIFTERKFGTSKMSGGIFNEALWGVIIMKFRSFFLSYKDENTINKKRDHH